MNIINIKKIEEFKESEIVGNKIINLDTVTSTNEYLANLTNEYIEDGTVVIADSQTGGKGRMNRKWYSPGQCNIYLSVMFKPEINPQYSAVFTFIASLAIVDTLKNLDFDPEIKWPNDVLIKKKKVSGVLTEMKTSGAMLENIIVGIGLNVNLTKDDIKKSLPEESEKVTSLFIENGKEINREYVISRLINNLDKYYKKFDRDGIHSIVAQWTNEWGKLNEEVSIDISGEELKGIVRKVDSYGYLYLEKDNGQLEKVISGDFIFNNQD